MEALPHNAAVRLPHLKELKFIQEKQNAATIITSNLTFERWEEVFHDPVLTSALTDRLTHRAHIINMVGGSYRILETKEWIEKSNF